VFYKRRKESNSYLSSMTNPFAILVGFSRIWNAIIIMSLYSWFFSSSWQWTLSGYPFSQILCHKVFLPSVSTACLKSRISVCFTIVSFQQTQCSLALTWLTQMHFVEPILYFPFGLFLWVWRKCKGRALDGGK
jgi:hypothetical protein